MRLPDFLRLPLSEKLARLQSLVDGRTLTAGEAEAMFRIVHAELERSGAAGPEDYRRYAALMESLQAGLPAIHRQLSAARPTRPKNPGGVDLASPEADLLTVPPEAPARNGRAERTAPAAGQGGGSSEAAEPGEGGDERDSEPADETESELEQSETEVIEDEEEPEHPEEPDTEPDEAEEHTGQDVEDESAREEREEPDQEIPGREEIENAREPEREPEREEEQREESGERSEPIGRGVPADRQHAAAEAGEAAELLNELIRQGAPVGSGKGEARPPVPLDDEEEAGFAGPPEEMEEGPEGE